MEAAKHSRNFLRRDRSASLPLRNDEKKNREAARGKMLDELPHRRMRRAPAARCQAGKDHTSSNRNYCFKLFEKLVLGI
jgi:hypothetical protein